MPHCSFSSIQVVPGARAAPEPCGGSDALNGRTTKANAQHHADGFAVVYGVGGNARPHRTHGARSCVQRRDADDLKAAVDALERWLAEQDEEA